MFVTHKRLTNACNKAGYTVKQEGKTRWSATNPKNNKRITWGVQDDGDNGELTAVCVCQPSKDTDVNADYFCDYFPETIKAAIHCIA